MTLVLLQHLTETIVFCRHVDLVGFLCLFIILQFLSSMLSKRKRLAYQLGDLNVYPI